MSGMVQHDLLRKEIVDFSGRVVLGLPANIVTGNGLRDRSVMHLYRFDFTFDVCRGKGRIHPRLQGTRLDYAKRVRSNTYDLVDIVKRKSQWASSRSYGRIDRVTNNRLLLKMGLLRSFKHIISDPTRDRNKQNSVRLLSKFLQEPRDFFLDLSVFFLIGIDCFHTHLVAAKDHLLDAQREGQQDLIMGFSITQTCINLEAVNQRLLILFASLFQVRFFLFELI